MGKSKGASELFRISVLFIVLAFFLLQTLEQSAAVTSSSKPNATIYRPGQAIGGNVSITLYGDGTSAGRDNISGNSTTITFFLVNFSGTAINQSNMTVGQFILNASQTFASDNGTLNDVNASRPWEGSPERNITFPSSNTTTHYNVSIANFFGTSLLAPDPKAYSHYLTIKLNATYSNASFPFPGIEITSSVASITVNSLPSLGAPDNWTLEDTAPPNMWFNLTAHSQDNDNDSLSYAILSQSNSSLINCVTTQGSYVNCSSPTQNLFGSSFVTVNVSDGIEYYLGNFTVFVNSSNDIPSAFVISPQNNSINYNGSVSFNCSATDVEGLLNISLYSNFSGTWSLNQTTNATNTSNYTVFSKTLPTGAYVWGCSAGDANGAVNFSLSNSTIIVNVDSQSPLWSGNITSPNTSVTYSQNAVYWLNITVTDDKSGINLVLIEHNFSGSFANYTPGNQSSLYYYSWTDLRGSNYTYRWIINDSVGNVNYTSAIAYSVTKAQNPIDLIIRNTTDQKNQNVTITYPSGINATVGGKGPLFIFRNNTNATTEINSTIVLSAAAYSYRANSSGNENYSSNDTGSLFYLAVNKASPSLQLLLNGTAANATITNYTVVNSTATANNAQSNVSILINGSLYQNGSSPQINLTLFQGLPGNITNITALYPDSQNYSMQTSTYWAIILAESQPPRVENVSVNPSSANQGQSVNISANVTDASGILSVYANVTYANGTFGVVQMSLSGSFYNVTFNATNIDPAGSYQARIYATDINGNVNSTRTINFTINDTNAPKWSLNTSAPSSYSSYAKNASYQFNITWFEDTSFGIAYIEHNFNGTSLNYTLSSFEQSSMRRTFYYNNYDIPSGSYLIRFYANDSSNLWNSSDTFTYNVSKAAAVLRLPITPSNQTTYPNAITANGSFIGTDNAYNLTLLRNGSIVNQTGLLAFITEQITLASSMHNYTLVYNGSQNYSFSKIENITNITKAAVQVMLFINGTRGNYTVTKSFSINITALANVSVNVSVYYNITGNESFIGNSSLLTNFTQTSGINVSTYYAKANFSGDANFTSSSEQWFIVVNNSAILFSGIQSSVTSTTATITWNTSDYANSAVLYGTNSNVSSNVSDASFVISHSIGLTGLTPSTLYYYNVSSCNAISMCNSTGTYNFTTSASTTTTTAASSSSGGGGGEAPSSSAPSKKKEEATAEKSQATATFSLPSISPSTPMDIRILDNAISVSHITADVTKAMQNASITISATKAPQNAPKLEAYQVIRIDTNIDQTAMKPATINFEVNKSWLSANGIERGNVYLFRLTDKWDQLETTLERETSTKAFYRAVTPGFSYFAVAKGAKETPTGEVSKAIEASNAGFNYTYILVGLLPLSAVGYAVKKRRKKPLEETVLVEGVPEAKPVKDEYKGPVKVEITKEKKEVIEKKPFEVINDKDERSNAFVFSNIDENTVLAMKPVMENCTVTKMRAKISLKLEMFSIKLRIFDPLEAIADGVLLSPKTCQYFSIEEKDGCKAFKEMVIQFRVDKTWIAASGLLPEDIRLLKYDTQWKTLETTAFAVDDTHYYYLAIIKEGFTGFYAVSRRHDSW